MIIKLKDKQKEKCIDYLKGYYENLNNEMSMVKEICESLEQKGEIDFSEKKYDLEDCNVYALALAILAFRCNDESEEYNETKYN